jgi:hypothetical protein
MGTTPPSLVVVHHHHSALEPHPMISDGWDALQRYLVFFHRKLVGTIAAMDPTEDFLNYNQVWWNTKPDCSFSFCGIHAGFISGMVSKFILH